MRHCNKARKRVIKMRTGILLLVVVLAMTVQPVSSIQASALPKGYLVVTFDDGRDGALTYAAPMFQRDGIKASMFVYEESLYSGWQGFLNLDGALELQNSYGWQFEGHSLTHPDMNHLSSSQLSSEITESRKLLQGSGFRPIATFAYPYETGWDNATVIGLVKQDYVAARRSGNLGSVPVTYDRSRQLGPTGCTVCPPDRYQLEGNVVTNSTSVGTVTGYIDQAIANHTVLILVFHQIVPQKPQQYEYGTSDLKTIADYANQRIQSGVLESLYFSDAIQLLFGISSFLSCGLLCSVELALTSINGVVIATAAGVVWAILLVGWNHKRSKSARTDLDNRQLSKS
jgi:peptidoglycan/xylan/chitin deacetylase (PgdA/CDA1 family)